MKHEILMQGYEVPIMRTVGIWNAFRILGGFLAVIGFGIAFFWVGGQL